MASCARTPLNWRRPRGWLSIPASKKCCYAAASPHGTGYRSSPADWLSSSLAKVARLQVPLLLQCEATLQVGYPP